MDTAARRTAFASDDSGAVATISVLVIGGVFAMEALSIDVSQICLTKCQQQRVTDLAAVAAAAKLAANGLPAADLIAVDLGTYAADQNVPVSQRFVAGGGTSVNAARVTLQSDPASFFAGALGSAAEAAPIVSTTSIAENADTADFSLGSSE